MNEVKVLKIKDLSSVAYCHELEQMFLPFSRYSWHFETNTGLVLGKQRLRSTRTQNVLCGGNKKRGAIIFRLEGNDEHMARFQDEHTRNVTEGKIYKRRANNMAK